MKNKLVFNFINAFILVAVLSFCFTTLIGSQLTYNHQFKLERDALYEEANYLGSGYALNYYEGSITISELKNQFYTLGIYYNCDIMLIASDGTIIVDTGSNEDTVLEEFDTSDFGSRNYMTGNFYGLYNESRLSVFYPVNYSYLTRSYIVISKPIASIRQTADSFTMYNYITMIVTLLMSGILIFLFIKSIISPLKKITAATSDYAKGDFSKKIQINRNDEIGMLGDSLDYMAMEINNLNNYQRNFIANISHDFRSPLTSIKGYLEAMLDGTIPPEMQEKYLAIVISETERLTKLTNNLLTLNNVNEKGMVLDLSDFDIVKIIKQTIETFEGTCVKKHLKFKLVFSDKELYVNADQSKIQQVIYNLIDNAIKFSNADSSIIISASERNDKISISVKDFGIGIPKESVAKIWERFYKSDLSRGKDKKGTGLGLAIVKDIIAAHKSYIDVISTEGVGTEFIFSLPKPKSTSGN